jgi:bifunctional non-homologous end joining protein LigD
MTSKIRSGRARHARAPGSRAAQPSPSCPAAPRVVSTERTVAAPGVERKRRARGPIPGAREAALPSFVAPQLATLVDAPPVGDVWLHETKLDGYRILCRLSGGRATLWSRNRHDWSANFPEIAAAASALPAREAFLDGEIAVVLGNGTTSFQALQNALSGEGRNPIVYFVFDLLHLDGLDLRGATLEHRKAALERLLPSRRESSIRYSHHVVGQGESFFREACRLGLEGIVSKRRDRPYESARGRTWLKVKCTHEQEFVIAGFTEPKGTRAGLGALLLGVHDGAGALVYAGKVGTGFTTSSVRALRDRLDRLRVSESPFRLRPPGAAGIHWVKPELVAQVQFTEWTDDGRLRHPTFRGLREDKPARDIVRERAEHPRPPEPRSPR